MSRYDFLSLVDRTGTFSLKWENPNNVSGKADILPLWVADMDFPVIPEVQKALQKRVEHPVYGYMRFPKEYWTSLMQWHKSRYARNIAQEHLIAAPSVMHALSMAVRGFTAPKDRIMIQPPVYYPFFKVIRLNDREVIEAPLTAPSQDAQPWTADWSGVEKVLQACQKEGKPVKVWLFCSPQNPTGRVWTLGELKEMARIAQEYDLLVICDEIHADLVQPDHPFISLYDLPELADRSLVFAGPNKTFNLAGMSLCHGLIRNEKLFMRFKKIVEADFFNEPNIMSITAAWAAYDYGSDWVDEVLKIIRQNHALLTKHLETWPVRVPVMPQEGTYLAWSDTRKLMDYLKFDSDVKLAEFWEKEGRVKVSQGSIYQTGGSGWFRWNLACPTAQLEQGLNRIEKLF